MYKIYQSINDSKSIAFNSSNSEKGQFASHHHPNQNKTLEIKITRYIMVIIKIWVFSDLGVGGRKLEKISTKVARMDDKIRFLVARLLSRARLI